MNRSSSRNNWLKFKTSRKKYILEESIYEYTSNEWKPQKPEDVNMEPPVGFKITRILTDYMCPKTSRDYTAIFTCVEATTGEYLFLPTQFPNKEIRLCWEGKKSHSIKNRKIPGFDTISTSSLSSCLLDKGHHRAQSPTHHGIIFSKKIHTLH